jgi:hypothetical protein
MRLFAASLMPLSSSPSAETLTGLLASLSLLFKHLLASEAKALEETWATYVSTLTRCNSEVQRGLAEVWGTVLRRLNPEIRVIAVNFILRDYESISDVAAWIFISAFKVDFLLKFLLSCQLILIHDTVRYSHSAHLHTLSFQNTPGSPSSPRQFGPDRSFDETNDYSSHSSLRQSRTIFPYI